MGLLVCCGLAPNHIAHLPARQGEVVYPGKGLLPAALMAVLIGSWMQDVLRGLAAKLLRQLPKSLADLGGWCYRIGDIGYIIGVGGIRIHDWCCLLDTQSLY